MRRTSNYTFEEISNGQTASYSRLDGEQEILLLAAESGDVDPVHLDAKYAAGRIYLGQPLPFCLPMKIGDEIMAQLEVTGKREDKKFITLDCKAINQHGKTVESGTAEEIARGEKIIVKGLPLPCVHIGI